MPLNNAFKRNYNPNLTFSEIILSDPQSFHRATKVHLVQPRLRIIINRRVKPWRQS